MDYCGFDCGTYNLIACKRDTKGNFDFQKSINAFTEISLKDKFLFNIMRSKNVKLVEWPEGNLAYIVGEAAVKMAYAIDKLELKRPMINGCINPKEKLAQEVMNIMLHDLIGKLNQDALLYYSVPANAVNQDTDADYHSLVLKAMFDAFEDENGYKVDARPINEALAVIYGELEDKGYTGISASAGAGMINVCYAIYGAPVFQFSIVNSGDWIDKQAAKACSESVTFINQEKMNVNLNEEPISTAHQAIKLQYELMIQKMVAGIKDGLEKSGTKFRTDEAINFVATGGTASPIGFKELLEKHIHQANLPVKIDEVIKPVDNLNSVAKGCLIAAENAI